MRPAGATPTRQRGARASERHPNPPRHGTLRGRYQQRTGVSSGSARSCARVAPGGTDPVLRRPATRSPDRGWGGRHGRASSRAQPSGFVASVSPELDAGSAERCGGPRTGRVRRRAEAGGEAPGGEHLPDGRRALNPGDDCHRPAAPGTEYAGRSGTGSFQCGSDHHALYHRHRPADRRTLLRSRRGIRHREDRDRAVFYRLSPRVIRSTRAR